MIQMKMTTMTMRNVDVAEEEMMTTIKPIEERTKTKKQIENINVTFYIKAIKSGHCTGIIHYKP